MGRQRLDLALWLQDAGRDLPPEWRAGDVGVDDVVDSHRLGRNRATGIDQSRPASFIDAPTAVRAERDVLPADLADVVRAVSGGLQIDDADARRMHVRNMGAGDPCSKRGVHA